MNARLPLFCAPSPCRFCILCFHSFRSLLSWHLHALWLRFPRKAIRNATTGWQHPPVDAELPGGGQPGGPVTSAALKECGRARAEHTQSPGSKEGNSLNRQQLSERLRVSFLLTPAPRLRRCTVSRGVKAERFSGAVRR